MTLAVPPQIPQGSAQLDWLWWIPLLPLAASAVCGILHFLTLRQREAAHPRRKVDHRHGHDGHGDHGHGEHDEHAHEAHHDAHADHGHAKVSAGIGALASVVAVLAMAAALALSIKGFLELKGLDAGARVLRSTSWDWIDAGSFSIDIAMHLDPLSSVMTLVVTGIGSLIFLYASGYMKGDAGYAKFFAYLSLFAFSMLMLVLSSSMLGLFVGWEGVGLCSYLLIGFWYEKSFAAEAGQKAFVMNRIGDACFLIGTFLLVRVFGSLDMAAITAGVPGALVNGLATPELFAAGLLLFGGACGKSAQIPLFTWLPDAMAGPTPVSALIHAATMVTAGVYLVVRLNPLFAASPQLLAIIGVIAALTAFIAGSTALVQRDIKKVLAYSTVSQLGFMFLGLASGAWAAAVFHLVTHAFFKALLFLGAGSVIHGMHEEQDMHKMGGLKKYMPATFVTFVCGAAALSGLPLMSGFFSKDEILAHTFAHGGLYTALWIVGIVTAAMTAYYTWRMVALTFFGEERFDKNKVHPHESPAVMTLPLMVLAVLSVVGGLLGLPIVFHAPHLLAEWLEPVTRSGTKILFDAQGKHELSHALEWALLGAGALVALVFAHRGFHIHKQGVAFDQGFEKRWPRTAAFLGDAWTIDTKYTRWITQPIKLIAFVIAVVVDQFAIDGLVNGVGALAKSSGQAWRRQADGSIATYGLWMGAFTALIAFLFLFADILRP
ncbi:MAG: NADH-quinone oxidoreductase subunit L [Planctomycetota bacterium]|nr:NADH-quinone oxidoreductase subunit L [Planctomycetota bacterium]